MKLTRLPLPLLWTFFSTKLLLRSTCVILLRVSWCVPNLYVQATTSYKGSTNFCLTSFLHFLDVASLPGWFPTKASERLPSSESQISVVGPETSTSAGLCRPLQASAGLCRPLHVLAGAVDSLTSNKRNFDFTTVKKYAQLRTRRV